MNSDKREITSALTHLGGALLGLIGMILLLLNAIQAKNLLSFIAFLVFGLSVVLLYSASTIYHFIDKSKQRAKLIMRKLDHIMIFVLIAGTYTPVCLLVLNKTVGLKLLILVWTITIIGAFIKMFWINAPSWVSASLYIAMGWMAALVLKPLVNNMSLGGMFWLVFGGLLYTVGGVIYAIKKPKINKLYFGFHELFHLFVLAGTFCHYMMMYFYVG